MFSFESCFRRVHILTASIPGLDGRHCKTDRKFQWRQMRARRNVALNIKDFTIDFAQSALGMVKPGRFMRSVMWRGVIRIDNCDNAFSLALPMKCFVEAGKISNYRSPASCANLERFCFDCAAKDRLHKDL